MIRGSTSSAVTGTASRSHSRGSNLVRAAAYVVVAHRGYNEVYPFVGGVPVRIAGDDVDIASSRATFAISEHAADGSRLRDYELEAAVSG